MISPRIRRRIKYELSAEKPTVWIGKNGVSPEILTEIEGQLDRTEMVKVKILKTALAGNDAKTIAIDIAHQTTSSLVEVRGHTFMLYRKKKKPQS